MDEKYDQKRLTDKLESKRLTENLKSLEECRENDILPLKNKDLKLEEKALAEFYGVEEYKKHLPKEGVHYTYADYCTWDDDVRYELIDGVPYLMSAPESRRQGERKSKANGGCSFR